MSLCLYGRVWDNFSFLNLSFQHTSKPYSNPHIYATPERRLYEMLCRNEIRLTPAELSKLRCKYVTNNSPFLTIAPLKLEEAYLKPYIVIYHDVIYDSEIDVVKTMAKPRVHIC